MLTWFLLWFYYQPLSCWGGQGHNGVLVITSCHWKLLQIRAALGSAGCYRPSPSDTTPPVCFLATMLPSFFMTLAHLWIELSCLLGGLMQSPPFQNMLTHLDPKHQRSIFLGGVGEWLSCTWSHRSWPFRGRKASFPVTTPCLSAYGRGRHPG